MKRRLPIFERITKETDSEDEVLDIPNLVYKATSNHTTESTEGDEEGFTDYNECWKKLIQEDSVSHDDSGCRGNKLSAYSLFKDSSLGKKIVSSEKKQTSQSMKDPAEYNEEQDCNEFSLFSNDFFSVNFNHEEMGQSEEERRDIWLQVDKISFLNDRLCQ